MNIDKDSFLEFFSDSVEAVLIIDSEKNILYMNSSAKTLVGKPATVSEIQHLITFDVCVLDNEKILDCNPLQEAVSIEEKLKSEVQVQLSESEYRKFYLRSLKNGEYTVIILSEAVCQEEIKAYQAQILELSGENKDFAQLQEKARNLAVRTGLINRISTSIRDSLDLDKVIGRALEEISTTLGLDKSCFAEYNPENRQLQLKNSWNFNDTKILDFDNDSGIKQAISRHEVVVSAVMTDQVANLIQPRLVAPVLYQDEVLGVMVFYHVNNKKSWHEEEVSLIEGLTSQLASAISQARLFETVSEQKNELEDAILQLKETQAQLIQSEKMASLGQLVAGVAHEINTPLGSINSNNGIFARCLEKINIDDETVKEILNDAIGINNEAISRINDLVKSLKNFARLDEAEYQEADLNEGIKSTLMMINHELGGKIEVVEELGDLPLVKCYPNQLNQVFMNLLVNACQSIEEQGTITIKTEKQNEKAVIIVTDTGKGISEENLPKIFDPGFTTKGVGVGTGLGLSICYQIIEKHNGKISVESNVGSGTTFKVEIPIKHMY